MNHSISFLIFFHLLYAVSFYDLTVTKADGNQLQMSALNGKNIIVFAFNPGNPDSTQLLAMDSIQLSNPSLTVIAVPAIEFSDSASISLESQKTSSGYSFTMTKPMLVTKNSGSSQDPLFAWLTHVDQNIHFDSDVEGEGQTYYINEKGILYGVMGRQASTTDILSVLEQ